EIPLPTLENGYYLILAEPKPDIKIDASEKAFAYGLLQATNLALVETSTDLEDIFQVVDRNNGSPIEGAQVKLSHTKNYDGPILGKTLTTDKTGRIRLQRSKDRWTNVSIEVSYKNEQAYFGEYYIQQKYV